MLTGTCTGITLMQLSAKAGDTTIRTAEHTSCLEHMASGRVSLCVSRAIRTKARCNK